MSVLIFFIGQKTIPEQIQLVAEKWDPNSCNTVFQTYLYNQVPEDQAPFYRPGPQDDEAKWEEALQKKPSPGSIPVLYKGFYQLGQRLLTQQRHLDVLQGRLHEINNSLTVMLQNHDLVISIRAADCRRKHLTLSHRCLALATKVQILRNRGYAMDNAEEELRKMLLALEKGVFDPALTGRGEEIWARMLGVRERARQLQAEFEKSGKGLPNVQGQELDEEVAKKAKKVSDVLCSSKLWKLISLYRSWMTTMLSYHIWQRSLSRSRRTSPNGRVILLRLLVAMEGADELDPLSYCPKYTIIILACTASAFFREGFGA